MRYLKSILFVFFIGAFQTSLASGPGFDGDDYDLGQAPYNDGNGSNYDDSTSYEGMSGEEDANIESIRRNLNTDTTVPYGKNMSSTRGLKLSCDTTPAIRLSHVPLTPIKKSNNLIRKPGSAVRAEGQYIIISGQVVDRDCLPVSDAVINIWQTDTNGKYIEAYRTTGDWDVRDNDYDKNFAYSGSTQTNNLGEYNFITILPTPAVDELAPHINIHVKHPDFADLKTRIYFNRHPLNKADRDLKELDEEQKKLVIAKGKAIDPMEASKGRIYNYDITLEGINKFRRY